MGEYKNRMVTRKEMIKTIIIWYTHQLKNDRIKWKHYQIFIKFIYSLTSPTLYTYYKISKSGLEKEESLRLELKQTLEQLEQIKELE